LIVYFNGHHSFALKQIFGCPTHAQRKENVKSAYCRVELAIVVYAIFIGGYWHLTCFDIFIPIAEVYPKKISVF
jgi:hypothetical protein